MSNKKLIILALVGVIILAVVLSLALSKKSNSVSRNNPATIVYNPSPVAKASADVTTGTKSVKSSVDVVYDNVKTGVTIK
jgi:Flp pilus assembly protein CpaB